MRLNQNVGTADRVVRVLVAAALAASIVSGALAGPLSYIAGAIAAIMFVTGATGFCPLYALLGIRTCPVRRV